MPALAKNRRPARVARTAMVLFRRGNPPEPVDGPALHENPHAVP